MTWIGVPFHRVTTQSSSPLSHFSAPPMPVLSDWTCSKDSGFMKCQYSPSLYRYCMSVSITSAASIESVAFMVTSCRSEEHTSELQSLMRISYAVFCLKKKNKRNKNEQHHEHRRRQNKHNIRY